MTLVISHAHCPDGSTAAWVAQKALRFCTIWMADHGSAPPDCTDKDVLMLDFTYPNAQMRTIREQCGNLTILDHHQTALKNVEGIKFDGMIDQDRSGARLTWDWFFPSGLMPAVLLRVEDRDLWRFNFEDTNDVMAAFMADDFESLTRVGELMAEGAESLAARGKTVNMFRDKLVQQAVEAAFEVTIAGHKVLASNCPYTIGSDVAGKLAVGRPFGAYWFVNNGLEQWGLRSAPDGLDVASIAEGFGGGGHFHASGFRGANIEIAL